MKASGAKGGSGSTARPETTSPSARAARYWRIDSDGQVPDARPLLALRPHPSPGGGPEQAPQPDLHLGAIERSETDTVSAQRCTPAGCALEPELRGAGRGAPPSLCATAPSLLDAIASFPDASDHQRGAHLRWAGAGPLLARAEGFGGVSTASGYFYARGRGSLPLGTAVDAPHPTGAREAASYLPDLVTPTFSPGARSSAAAAPPALLHRG